MTLLLPFHEEVERVLGEKVAREQLRGAAVPGRQMERPLEEERVAEQQLQALVGEHGPVEEAAEGLSQLRQLELGEAGHDGHHHGRAFNGSVGARLCGFCLVLETIQQPVERDGLLLGSAGLLLLLRLLLPLLVLLWW